MQTNNSEEEMKIYTYEITGLDLQVVNQHKGRYHQEKLHTLLCSVLKNKFNIVNGLLMVTTSLLLHDDIVALDRVGISVRLYQSDESKHVDKVRHHLSELIVGCVRAGCNDTADKLYATMKEI